MRPIVHTEVIILTSTVVLVAVLIVFFQTSSIQAPALSSTAASMQTGEVKGEVEVAREYATTGYISAQSDMQRQYEQHVSRILEQHNSGSLNIAAAPAAYGKIVNQLLAVKVPLEYQSLHLQLVIAFEALQQRATDRLTGTAAAEAEFFAQQHIVQQLRTAHSWLAE